MRKTRWWAVMLAVGLAWVPGASAQNFTIADRAQNRTASSNRFQEKQSEVTMSSRTFVRYNSVGGNTARSFFDEGWYYEEHFSLQEAGVNSRGNEFQLNFDFRVTNEDRVDPDTFLVQNFAYREWNDRFMLEVGDIFHEFNHLTLNRNLKGVAYTRFADGEDRKWEMTFLAGVDKSRWQHLFNDTALESLTRHVLAMRADREFRGGDDRLAFNFVRARDDRGSAPQNPGLIAAESNTLSVDAKKTFDGNWKMFLVYGVSESNPNLAAGAPDQWGQAVNVDVQYQDDAKKVFGRTRFQSTDPQYLALEGSPVPDFEKLDTNWRVQASDTVEVQAKWETFENNLDDQLGVTTETEVPSLAATYRHPSRPFRFDVRWEDREIEASDGSRNQEIEDVNVRAENRFGQVRAVIDYNAREDQDNVTPRTIESDQVTLTLDSRIRRSDGTQVIPALSYQYREQDNLVTQTVQDEIDTWNLRVGWILRNRRTIRVAYRRQDRDDGQVGVAADSETSGWELNYSMPVGQDQNDQLTVRVLHNDNEFEVPGNDFDETMSQVSYTHRF